MTQPKSPSSDAETLGQGGELHQTASAPDARLTTKTQDFWQQVMDEKGKGYDTMIRLWPLKVKK